VFAHFTGQQLAGARWVILVVHRLVVSELEALQFEDEHVHRTYPGVHVSSVRRHASLSRAAELDGPPQDEGPHMRTGLSVWVRGRIVGSSEPIHTGGSQSKWQPVQWQHNHFQGTLEVTLEVRF